MFDGLCSVPVGAARLGTSRTVARLLHLRQAGLLHLCCTWNKQDCSHLRQAVLLHLCCTSARVGTSRTTGYWRTFDLHFRAVFSCSFFVPQVSDWPQEVDRAGLSSELEQARSRALPVCLHTQGLEYVCMRPCVCTLKVCFSKVPLKF